jgi:hypothetical protein
MPRLDWRVKVEELLDTNSFINIFYSQHGIKMYNFRFLIYFFANAIVSPTLILVSDKKTIFSEKLSIKKYHFLIWMEKNSLKWDF